MASFRQSFLMGEGVGDRGVAAYNRAQEWADRLAERKDAKDERQADRDVATDRYTTSRGDRLEDKNDADARRQGERRDKDLDQEWERKFKERQQKEIERNNARDKKGASSTAFGATLGGLNDMITVEEAAAKQAGTRYMLPESWESPEYAPGQEASIMEARNKRASMLGVTNYRTVEKPSEKTFFNGNGSFKPRTIKLKDGRIVRETSPGVFPK